MSESKTSDHLFQLVRELIENTQKLIVRNVNTTIVFTYFQIGRMIVEDQQEGKSRAGYAKETIRQLSEQLTMAYGKGYSTANLEYFRQYYTIYHSLIPQTLFGKLEGGKSLEEFSRLFPLSWSHYIQLMKIKNPQERRFYEIEAAQNNWSVRELQRQYHSSLYERLALSRNKTFMWTWYSITVYCVVLFCLI